MSSAPLLPRADEAVIPAAKLVGCALDPEHPRGRHKARVFASALGFRLDNWRELHDQILERLPGAPVTAIRMSSGGQLYEVPLAIDGPNGRTQTVITAWLVRETDAAPGDYLRRGTLSPRGPRGPCAPASYRGTL